MVKRRLTEEQMVILSLWEQNSYCNGDRLHSGGRSDLEIAEEYLKRNKILNSKGLKNKNII